MINFGLEKRVSALIRATLFELATKKLSQITLVPLHSLYSPTLPPLSHLLGTENFNYRKMIYVYYAFISQHFICSSTIEPAKKVFVVRYENKNYTSTWSFTALYYSTINFLRRE